MSCEMLRELAAREYVAKKMRRLSPIPMMTFFRWRAGYEIPAQTQIVARPGRPPRLFCKQDLDTFLDKAAPPNSLMGWEILNLIEGSIGYRFTQSWIYQQSANGVLVSVSELAPTYYSADSVQHLLDITDRQYNKRIFAEVADLYEEIPLSMTEIAKACDISVSYLSYIVSGKRYVPDKVYATFVHLRSEYSVK